MSTAERPPDARGRRLGALAAATALLLVAGPAAAQVSVGAAGLGTAVEHRVEAGRGVQQTSGTAFGGAATLGLGQRFELAFQGAKGTLNADSATAVDEDFSEAVARVAVLPVDWLAIVGGLSARSLAAPFARQRWVAARFGAEARLDIAGGALRGLARAELLPLVSVTGLENPTRAVAARAGLEWRAGVVHAALSYEVERYEFPAAGDVKRREQLATLTAVLGLHFGGRHQPL